jgi:hypothetical protein
VDYLEDVPGQLVLHVSELVVIGDFELYTPVGNEVDTVDAVLSVPYDYREPRASMGPSVIGT